MVTNKLSIIYKFILFLAVGNFSGKNMSADCKCSVVKRKVWKLTEELLKSITIGTRKWCKRK